MTNKANNLEEEESLEYIARLESDYDKLLLENTNLGQRISQYVGVCEDILKMANSDKIKKSSSKTIYGVQYEKSYDSLQEIPIMDLKVHAPKNYFEQPTTFE